MAQDADGHAFCYANADLRKGEEADDVLRFIDFGQRHHGALPKHLEQTATVAGKKLRQPFIPCRTARACAAPRA